MINEIILGNSVDLIKEIEHDSIHAIISDIPYGIGYADWDVLHNNTNSAYGGASKAQQDAGALYKRRGKPLNGWSESDKKIPLEYQQWCASWASEWYRVLVPGASCFIFAGRRYAHRCIVALEDAGFTFKDMIAWEKCTAPQRAQHLSAIFERREDLENARVWSNWRVANLRPLFEPILWFQKPYRIGGTIADNVLENQVGAWNEQAFFYFSQTEHGQGASNVIRVRTDSEDYGKHDAQKPLQLMEFLVALVTIKGQTILDPFAGSGTVCVAAKRLDRNYVGMEIEPSYVAIANERLNSSFQGGLFSI